MLSKFFIVLYVFLFINSIFCQSIDKYERINWRIYHSLNWKDFVDYKSNEWKNMSVAKKHLLLQIPQEELKTMTTEELIMASIDCTSAREIGKYSSVSSYFILIHKGFNGFYELTMREDVCEKIIMYYNNLDLKAISVSSAGLNVKQQIKILEYLLVHPKLIMKYNTNEVHQLLNHLKTKYTAKEKMPNIYNEQDTIPNIYAIARVLQKIGQPTRERIQKAENVDFFLDTGIFLTRETREQIIRISNEF